MNEAIKKLLAEHSELLENIKGLLVVLICIVLFGGCLRLLQDNGKKDVRVCNSNFRRMAFVGDPVEIHAEKTLAVPEGTYGEITRKESQSYYRVNIEKLGFETVYEHQMCLRNRHKPL